MSVIALQKYISKLDSRCKKSKGRSLTMTDISLYGVFVDNEAVGCNFFFFFWSPFVVDFYLFSYYYYFSLKYLGKAWISLFIFIHLFML